MDPAQAHECVVIGEGRDREECRAKYLPPGAMPKAVGYYRGDAPVPTRDAAGAEGQEGPYQAGTGASPR